MGSNGLLLGVSMEIRRILKDAEAVAPTEWKVLITGERGVGKKELARLIHRRSPRWHLPVATIDCTGEAEMVESALIAHLRGRVSGGSRHESGSPETTDCGMVLLDEVGALSLRMQSVLLQCLDNGGSHRVGSGGRERYARVVALSSRDLLPQVRRQAFHEDLYYRLNVVHLMIPPLRERPHDINVLFDQFRTELSHQLGVPACTVTPEARVALARHDWPGNVCELKSVAERVILTRGGRVVTEADLALETRQLRHH